MAMHHLPSASTDSAVSLISSKRSFIRKNLLFMLTVMSVFAGFGLGLSLRSRHLDDRCIELIGFPGEILMNVLKMFILPLIAASLLSGLSQMDTRQSGKIGGFALLYYCSTMFLAVMTGIVLVLVIHPGDPTIKKNFGHLDQAAANISGLEKLMDLLRNMFPDNLVQATFQQVETEYTQTVTEVKGPNGTFIPKITVQAIHKYINGMNVLGLIIFFITMGLVMGNLGKRAKPLADLFHALDAVITSMVGIFMWFSPIGIASLIAAKILEIDDLAKTAQMLAVYMLTVVLGLMIQAFVTLPIILYLASKKNPFKFISGLGQAIVTALGTSSSAASLPVTFRCLEEVIGVDSKYTKFVLPVGSIVNMDGTALYEAVASVFIAQMNGIEMTFGTVLTISFTATLASIGAASIPSAGLVTMLIVLTAVGLPASDITLIIAVDWLLDRLRTAVNVIGDAVGCGFVEAMVERHDCCKVQSISQKPSGQLPSYFNDDNNSLPLENVRVKSPNERKEPL